MPDLAQPPGTDSHRIPPRASLSQTVAHFVTNRRRWVLAAALLLGAVAALIIVLRVQLASDVLDLLPHEFESVKAFKTFDREFSQAREITFGLLDDSGKADLDGFTEFFAAQLRNEPWIVRVMDRSPTEGGDSGDPARDLQAVAVPMLLNLDPTEFDRSIEQLEPDRIDARLKELHAKFEAGSPKAEWELTIDPLGIVIPALKPLASSFSVENTRPLVSPDGTLHVVLAITTQTELGAHACQDTMRHVEEFKRRVSAAWSGPAPQILVTGRTAYVGELSQKMRSDVVASVGSSAVIVALIFWIGFRRVRPLFAITHVLMLCCIIAIGIGTLLFHSLNMITIGLCSILIGLGVDFGMLLYGIYQAERDFGHDHETAIAAALRSQGLSICFGAITTAAAFLCLMLSGCDGFAQLGVLIACGIVVAGALMMTVFFLFIGKNHRPRNDDWVREGGGRFLQFALAHPRAIFLATTALLLALTVFCFLPVGRIRFEADPKSLEPKNSDAGIALRTIQARLAAATEPVLVLVEARDGEDFHQRWTRLQSAWDELVKQGRIKSAMSPAAFALSPARVAKNATQLTAARIDAARAALQTALEREGMQKDSFAATFAMLDSLAAIGRGDLASLDWRASLPANSPTWFILDHFLGRSPNVGAAYIVPAKKLASFEEKEQLRAMLTVPGVDARISGWSYTLQDLVPWAKGRLFTLTAAMLTLNVLLLAVLFRRWFPLCILMISLALSVGAMVASLKIFGVPLNLFNVLAFPLVLGVGVDYGIYVAIALRAPDPRRALAAIVKPVLLSGLCTVAGFGSLVTSQNPSLRGLGVVCAFGVAWCLFSTFCFILPAGLWRDVK